MYPPVEKKYKTTKVDLGYICIRLIPWKSRDAQILANHKNCSRPPVSTGQRTRSVTIGTNGVSRMAYTESSTCKKTYVPKNTPQRKD